MAFWVGKFTCLAAGSELRGVVTRVGTELGPGQHASTIDIAPERNYTHMVLPSPAPETVHLEIYETDCAARDPEDEEAQPTFIFDPAIRANRPVRSGDRVRVTGAWVTDNHWHTDESQARKFLRGGHEIWAVKTEFHPYSKKSMRLLRAPAPGAEVEQTLTVCAPVFREVFSYLWPPNVVAGLAHGAARTGQVVESSKQDEVAVEWFIEAAPPPWLSWFFSLVIEESVLQNRGEITRFTPVRTGNGFTIRVTARGTNPRDPAIFQARYTVRWEQVIFLLAREFADIVLIPLRALFPRGRR